VTLTLSRRIGLVFRINIQLLISSLCAMGAWACWPKTMDWLVLGMMSVFLAFAAVVGLVNALKAMLLIYEHDCALAAFEHLGPAPKSASMASHEALRKAGMI
jgi:hypothetical protein